MDTANSPSGRKVLLHATLILLCCDAVLFCCAKDEEEAEAFKNSVIEKMKDVCPVTIHMCYDLAPVGREFQNIAEICKHSVQRWFYITENAIQDPKMLFNINEQIMSSLKDNNSFIPIWSKPKEHFAQLPYGLQAYTGLYAQDKRITRRLRNMFDNGYHRGLKEHIRKSQELENQRRMTAEQKLSEEKERIQKEHQQKIVNTKTEVQAKLPQDSSFSETEDKLDGLHQDFKHLKLLQSRSHSSNPDAATPEYLFDSLDSAHSSVSSHRESSTKVYNITINQPGNVNIGGNIGVEADGAQENNVTEEKQRT